MFFTRRLLEYQIKDIPEAAADELQEWLEDNAVFSHIENAEYILWLPDSKEVIDDKYKAIPSLLKKVLTEAWLMRNEEVKASIAYLHEKIEASSEQLAEAQDFGYLLVVFS